MGTTLSMITDAQTELAQVRAAKTALYTNGQKHSLNGSHTFEGVTFKDLCKRERELTSLLLKLNGGQSSVLPDFSGV
jgi:hypothetical protein